MKNGAALVEGVGTPQFATNRLRSLLMAGGRLPCVKSVLRYDGYSSVAKKRLADEVLVSELQATLRGVGLRSTAARMAVLQRLRKATFPLSHAELAEELMPLGFDKATIFRNLADLTDSGLILRTELGDHVWRFELRDLEHPDNGQHPHFVCVDCGSVTCIEERNLAKQLKSVDEKIGSVTEILFRGHCKNCQ